MFSCRSRKFRPIYGRIGEVRALVPSGTPVLVLTATVTESMKADICGKLQLSGCRLFSTCPDRRNIYYEVVSRQDVETDMNSIASQLKETTVEMPRMIIYCRSRNLCADLYQFFLHYLGETSYYLLGAPKLCINRLFGTYHANTPSHNKQVIMQSMENANGIVRVVFATVALGMGVNFLDSIVYFIMVHLPQLRITFKKVEGQGDLESFLHLPLSGNLQMHYYGKVFQDHAMLK